MKTPFLWSGVVLLLSLISVSTSTPMRLGSDEVRITPLNRDVCLAKLLCGMSVVSIQDAHDSSGTKKDGEIYGEYAQIVGNFFQDNPPDELEELDDEGSLSQESVEALEDYSVSTEDDEVESVPIQSYQRPKRPELKKRVKPKLKKKPVAPTTAAPVLVKKIPTTKPTPPGIQIFDLGMPVQEGGKTPPRKPKSMSSHNRRQRNLRIFRARKIIKAAGLETQLRTVRQCQKIATCTYTFKQLYQKYGGKGVIDEMSQPIQPLPVVEEHPSRQPPSENDQISVKLNSHGQSNIFNSPWISPPTVSTLSPTPDDENFEYGSVNSKIPPGLEGYFQSSLTGINSPIFSKPGSAYKVKKVQKVQQIPQRLKKKKTQKKVSTTTEATTTTTTTEPLTTTTTTTEPPTTTSTTTKTTTTPPPRRIVHYKRPPSKRKPNSGEDDDDENINETSPIELIGHDEHDREQHQVDDEEDHGSNESHDDYDEEAKYETPVDYGNDEEDDDDDDEDDDDDDDDEDRQITKKPKNSKPNIFKIKNQRPEGANPAQNNQKSPTAIVDSRKDEGPTRVPTRAKSKKPVDKFTNDFLSVQSKRLKKLKKRKEKESKENSSEEDDFDDKDEKPVFVYPTQIGGRPIFPDYDVPVSMYAMSRTTIPAKPNPRPRPQASNTGGPPTGWGQASSQKSPTKDNNHHHHYYQEPNHSSLSSPDGNVGMGYEPSLSSGMSVLSPLKSLFKHLSSGISPNPVGGSMGYTNQAQQLHYKIPDSFSAPYGSSSTYPQGISIPQSSEDSDNIQVPQIAIMPKIPVGPESSSFKRPEKYTVNKTKRIPTL